MAAPTLFDGSALLLQEDLLHGEESAPSHVDQVPFSRLAASLRQAVAGLDHECALLVLELDHLIDCEPEQQMQMLDHVVAVVRANIRRTDILERLGPYTIAVALPGSARTGMTRVADMVRQRVGASSLESGDVLSTTVTIGAVHASESALADPEDLLLAALVNLDSARAAGRNRTNWSDF